MWRPKSCWYPFNFETPSYMWCVKWKNPYKPLILSMWCGKLWKRQSDGQPNQLQHYSKLPKTIWCLSPPAKCGSLDFTKGTTATSFLRLPPAPPLLLPLLRSCLLLRRASFSASPGCCGQIASVGGVTRCHIASSGGCGVALDLVPHCQLRRSWGDPAPEHMPESLPDRMPE